MKRAIKDLCQFSDEDLFAEIATGVGHVMTSVNSLTDAVRQLDESGHHHPARILENLATEEATKVLLLVDAVRCPRNKLRERSRTLGYFYDHLAKGIYAAACQWRLADFAEFKRYVDDERKSHVLDGPNDVDWIVPNSITQGREDVLYVQYIRDDTEEDGYGNRFWMPPRNDGALAVLSPDYVPDAIRIARALYQSNATAPEGLALLARIWRDVEIDESMSHIRLRALNYHTLDKLGRCGLLLESASTEACDEVVNNWTFPLWPLDLSEIRVSTESLREVRRQRSPDVY